MHLTVGHLALRSRRRSKAYPNPASAGAGKGNDALREDCFVGRVDGFGTGVRKGGDLCHPVQCGGQAGL